MDKHFTIWIKTDCSYCVSARDELYNQRVDHTIYIMDNKIEELNSLKKRWEHPTVPLIVHGDKAPETLIGGYDDLKKWFDLQKE